MSTNATNPDQDTVLLAASGPDEIADSKAVMHTTLDGWEVSLMTRPFGPWITMTWNAESREASIAIDKRAPLFFGDRVVIGPITNPRQARRIGLALAAALDTVAEVTRPGAGK